LIVVNADRFSDADAAQAAEIAELREAVGVLSMEIGTVEDYARVLSTDVGGVEWKIDNMLDGRWDPDGFIDDDGPYTDLGMFKIYHYAPTGNRTATGTVPEAGRTIAVDPDVIPLGSEVVINGHSYIAEDTGGDIKGNVVDVFVESREEAKKLGVRYEKVFVREVEK
jgi:3D (Asp-Asp-Asp) domain-containing protein